MDFSIHHKFLPPDELERALKALPPEAQALAQLENLEFLSWGHPNVPGPLADAAVMETFFNRPCSLCITDESGKNISVILGNFDHLNHEMIHVAQLYAKHDAQKNCFDMICDEGKTIIALIERFERLEKGSTHFTERTWCKKFLDPNRIGSYSDDERSERILNDFEKYLDRKPSRILRNMENIGIENTFGNDKIAIYSYYLRESGHSIAEGHAEKECVAYGFEHRLEAITPLFESALESARNGNPASGTIVRIAT